MKTIARFIKNNWTDPVWSKVFAGIILSITGGICAIAVAIYKEIPVSEIYIESRKNFVSISYFEIFISLLVFLAIIIPAIYANIIKFQLKNLKFPSKLKTEKFDLKQFLEGSWNLEYERSQQGHIEKGGEPVVFINGNHYLIRGKLCFVMTDIEFDEDKKELGWTKTIYPSNQKHARESIKIIDDKTIEGFDDIGFKLTYRKQ